LSILQVKLLGQFSLKYGDTVVNSLNTERLQVLLAYLCLHYDTVLSRQQIAGQLWVETTETEAKANLRRRIHDLKRLLPYIEQFIEIKPKTLRWKADSSCYIDVVELENAINKVKQAQETHNLTEICQYLEKAAKLYQGELLPECYDDWIVPLREELTQKVIFVYDQLISYLSELGETSKAINYAQGLLRLDPLSEKGYCHLMELYRQQGDRASALRVYHQCMTILMEELGVSPSPSTCKLYEQLLNLEDAEEENNNAKKKAINPSNSSLQAKSNIRCLSVSNDNNITPSNIISKSVIPSSNIPLIGRDQEWQIIQTWKQQENQNLPLLLLVGEAGIGKTRLLEELAHQIESESGYTLWGRSFEVEILRPYGIWLDAFRSLPDNDFSSELDSLLLDNSTQVNNTLNRSRLFDIGVKLIQHLTSIYSSILIVLDDIQWLDEASVAFLHYTIRLLSNSSVRFAATARKQELEENRSLCKFLEAFHREQRIKRLEIQPLDLTNTINLAHQICQNLDGEQIFADSGGNPLFTLEVARALVQGTISSDLNTLIQGRLLRLDENTRNLVSWAAALGSSFQPTTLANITNYSLPQLLNAVEQLEQNGIIRPSNSSNQEINYDFAHDIVRQVAYQQLSEPRRRLIHSHIAQTLHQLLPSHPDEIGNVAYHASLGGEHSLAASASLAASERHLRLFAYNEAAKVAQQGIIHCKSLETATRIDLHLKLLRVYIKTGIPKEQVDSVEKELKQLINEASLMGLKDVEAIGLESLIILSYDHHRLTQVQQHSLAAAERGRLASPATQAYMLAHTGSCLAEIGRDMTRAEVFLLEAKALSDRLGLQTIDIFLGLGIVSHYQGKTTEAKQLLEQSWKMSQLVQDHWRECLSLTKLVMLALEDNNPTVALDYCSELITVAAQMGEGSEAHHAAALDALAHYLLNDRDVYATLRGSCQSLKYLDSPRMLAYIQTIAAKYDLQQENLQQALIRASEALESANIVNNSSEQVLALEILITTEIKLNLQQEAFEHYQQLQKINLLSLSHRAETALTKLQNLVKIWQ
jgi:DNA-binding SARP family transcriptional activator/predicted ATPase